MSNSENHCKTRGCERCCWNTFLEMRPNKFELFRQELEARGVVSEEETDDGFRIVQAFCTETSGNSVVVYCRDHPTNNVRVQIIRVCPVLVNGGCGLIGDPARPSGCERLPFNGKECQQISSGGFTFIPAIDID